MQEASELLTVLIEVLDRLGGTTKAGMALRIAAGMGLGKLGSDATQGVFGGMV